MDWFLYDNGPRFERINQKVIIKEPCNLPRLTAVNPEPTPQNVQTHSNNSLAITDELFECV